MKEYNLIKTYTHKIKLADFWSTSGDILSEPEGVVDHVPLMWQGKRAKWTIEVEFHKGEYTCLLSFGNRANIIRKEITTLLDTAVEYIEQMMNSPNALEKIVEKPIEVIEDMFSCG